MLVQSFNQISDDIMENIFPLFVSRKLSQSQSLCVPFSGGRIYCHSRGMSTDNRHSFKILLGVFCIYTTDTGVLCLTFM